VISEGRTPAEENFPSALPWHLSGSDHVELEIVSSSSGCRLLLLLLVLRIKRNADTVMIITLSSYNP
jgi:hypothetical protein